MVDWSPPDYSLETGKYHATDFMPFFTPDSLDDLQGSPTAVFTLPVTVYWGPRRPPFDMSKPGDVVRAYTEIVGHADKTTQCRLLDKTLLVKHWRELFLDRRRVRPAWEAKFPELRNA